MIRSFNPTIVVWCLSRLAAAISLHLHSQGTTLSVVPYNSITILHVAQMFAVNITRSTYVHVLHAIKCDYLIFTILTINEYHSSSSFPGTLSMYTVNSSAVHSSWTTEAATHVHFPSRFTRQYSFAMYTRCIHRHIMVVNPNPSIGQIQNQSSYLLLLIFA